MKIILRNLRVVLTRFKTASILNILGLSIAFAAFIIIMAQVRYEQSFDSSYPDAERIYRAELQQDSTTISPLMSRPMIDVCLAASPTIECGALVECMSRHRYVQVEKSGTKVGFKEPIVKVYPEILSVFGYEFVDGSGATLSDPGRVLLPESVARRLFETSHAVGRTLTIEMGDQERSFEVGGVYRDLSGSSSAPNSIMMKIGDDGLNEWGTMQYYMYVKLADGARPEDFSAAVTATMAKVELPERVAQMRTMPFTLVPIKDLYYLKGRIYDLTPKGDRTTTVMLLSIALLIVAVAAINFVNFSTSLVPMRIKSINLQKVLGSPVPTLRTVMVCEAMGIALISMIISILWVDLASRTGLNQWLSTSISVDDVLPIVGLAALLSLVVGLISGLYPAYYATSFPPALVLKGAFGLSGSGRALRKGLIGFQFVVSIGLIIASLFMHLQNSYMRSFKTGMDLEQVAIVHMSNTMAKDHNTVSNRLRSNPVVVDVAYCNNIIGGGDTYSQLGRDFVGIEKSVQFIALGVSHNFLSMMGLTVVDGRDFTTTDELNSGIHYIFNQKAQSVYGLTTETKPHEEGKVVGFVKDFNYATLRQDIEPMAFFMLKDWVTDLDHAYVKISGDPYAAVDHIRAVFKELDPAFPISINFYDQVFDTTYQKERKTTALITIFSTLAIVLALVGVFGLVLFETQYRRKEIGLRKVHGASVGQILGMFGRSFVRIVIVCFVVAAPIAWWGVDEWLQSFPYRTELYWWVFLLALLIVLTITVATVVIQSYRAATANPINSLKSE